MRILFLLALFANSAFAAQRYQVALDLTLDGAPVEPMTVTLAEGSTASVGMLGDRRLFVEVSVNTAERSERGEEQLEITARISEQKGGRTVEHGSPAMIVALGRPASVAVGDASGKQGYELELTASRAPD
jgi:hypothetical protein